MTSPEPGFEIEVPSVEEFLKLLKEREEEGGDREGNGAMRRAVFVAQMIETLSITTVILGTQLLRGGNMANSRRAKGRVRYGSARTGCGKLASPPEGVPFGEKPRSFYGKSKSEAVRKLRASLRGREQGLSTEVDKLTIGQYLERWVEGPLRESVSAKTRNDYAWICRKHLVPAIGRMKLKKLTAEHLDDLYAQKVREGLSPRTVGYIHATIRVALQRAVKKRLIPFNVARDVDPPTRSQDDEDEKLTLSSAELAAFFKAAAEAENRFEALFIVGALAGPRPQELLGLKWPDLTLPDALGAPGEMRLIRKVSMSSEGLRIVEGLKGSRGKKKKRRTVYLLPEAVAALKAHRRRYLEERVRRAEKWEETWAKEPKARDLIFPSETGGPMNRDNLLKRDFKPLARTAGLPGEATLYTMRHTFATLWLESGENPKVLQEILGHSRIDVTLNVYSHVLPHIQQDAMDRFGQRFFGSSGSS